MKRAPYTRLHVHAAVLGVAVGFVEAALRSASWRGLGFFEQLLALCLAALVNLCVAMLAAIVARRFVATLQASGRGHPLALNPMGWVAGAVFALHALVLWKDTDPSSAGFGLAVASGAVFLGIALAHLFTPRWMGLAAFCAFWVAMIRGLPEHPEPGEGTSVLLITLDGVRPDRLGVYGGPVPTPSLDALAARGAVVEQAFTRVPDTELAHLDLLGGWSPRDEGGSATADPPQLLSQALSSRGYRTGASVSSSKLSGSEGWRQGFHVFDDDFGALPGLRPLSAVSGLQRLLTPSDAELVRDAQDTLARAQAFFQYPPRGPWFYWMHLSDAMGPFSGPGLGLPPTEGDPLELPGGWPPGDREVTSEDWLLRAYDLELQQLDEVVGALLEELNGQGLLEDTLVVVVGSQGQSLGEHGPLFQVGEGLFDTALRVPLIVAGPGVSPGTSSRCMVTTEQVHGRVSLASDSLDCAPESVLFTGATGKSWALRTASGKLIEGGGDQGAQLYDLLNDPGEQQAVQGPVDAWKEALQVAIEGGEAPAPPGLGVQAETLRELGYGE